MSDWYEEENNDKNFSQSPNTKPEPIQLINEQLDMVNEGIEFLNSLGEMKVAILSVMGPLFTGKSFLCNQLTGKNQGGFQIGSIKNQIETSTKGVWIWGEPIEIEDQHILLLDVEGFTPDGSEETIEYNKKLFELCSMISSLVIYNIKKGEEDEDNILSENTVKEAMSLFCTIAEGLDDIQLIDEDDSHISKKYVPQFLWINRDLKNCNNIKIKEDFIALGKEKEIYKKFFNNKIAFTSLCPPTENVVSLQMINNEDDNIDSLLTKEFINEMNNMKEYVFSQCNIKTINGIELNASMLSGLILEFSGVLSCGDKIKINEAFNSVIFGGLSEITNDIVTEYKDKITEQKANELYELIKNPFDVLTQGSYLEKYGETYIGKQLNSEFLVEQFTTLLSCIEEFISDNIKKEVENHKTKIQEIFDNAKEFTDFNMITLSLKNYLNSIFETDFFVFSSQLKSLFNFCLCDKINAFGTKISKESQEKLESLEKILTISKEDLNKKDSNIQILKNENNRIVQDLERQIEKLKFEKENEIDNLKQEKVINQQLIKKRENRIKVLEEKIKDLNTELSKARGKILDLELNLKKIQNEYNDYKQKEMRMSTEPFSKESIDFDKQNLNSLESILMQIQSSMKDFYLKVNKLEQNNGIIFKSDYSGNLIEYLQQNTNDMYYKLKDFREEQFSTNYEVFQMIKQTNNELQKNIKQLNNLVKEEKKKNEELKKQYEGLKKNCEDFKENFERQKKILLNQKELMEKKDELLEKQANDLTILSTVNGNYKILQSEVTAIFNVLTAHIKKEEKTKENNLSKLSKENKNQIENILKKFK